MGTMNAHTTPNSTGRDKIIDRINKLLAMADPERGATEAEQQQAMDRAQKLMFEHRVSLMEASKLSNKERESVTLKTYSATRAKLWELQFRYAILRALGGNAVKMNAAKGSQVYEYIGTPEQLDLMDALYERVGSWLRVQCRDARREANPSNPNAFGRAFYASASAVIGARLREREAAMATETTGGMELVRVDGARVDKFIGDRYGNGLRATKQRGYGNVGGHVHGRDAGSRADLSRGHVTGGNRTTLGA